MKKSRNFQISVSISSAFPHIRHHCRFRSFLCNHRNGDGETDGGLLFWATSGKVIKYLITQLTCLITLIIHNYQKPFQIWHRIGPLLSGRAPSSWRTTGRRKLEADLSLERTLCTIRCLKAPAIRVSCSIFIVIIIFYMCTNFIF